MRAWALDFDYQQQMIYWIEVTEWDYSLNRIISSMISVMHINGSGVQVSVLRMNDRDLFSKCL